MAKRMKERRKDWRGQKRQWQCPKSELRNSAKATESTMERECT
jgi:hypothetical protein